MDFFHDSVVLPGSSVAAHATTTTTTTTTTNKQNHSSTRLTPSLIRALRDPYHLIGAKPVDITNTTTSQKPKSGDGPALQDSEWRKQVLNLKISQATCYTDWLSAASELDQLEGNDAWKKEEESAEYDVTLVKHRLQELEEARISCDAKRMLFLARTSLTRDLGGMGHLRLYKHSKVGTKALIERYNQAALDLLDNMVGLCDPKKRRQEDGLDVREVYDQLLRARQAFGRSALLLSGGGTLGMTHIGVVKTLFEAQLLPRIISGASAGSIVASVLCTKVDDEIPRVLQEFCFNDLDVFEREGAEESVLKKVFRFCTKGALFDISNLIRVMRDLLGDMTFQEAYNRTRRILNIGVSTASLYELPRLLNYVTAPNVMIWSAVATSCSVPFVFSPAQLLAKDPRTGLEVPWDQSPQRWIDGSVDNDLPMTRLAEMFNVNHFIVSQVNPHVVPFLEREEEVTETPQQSANASWFRTVANLAKGEALHRLHVLAELNILPTTVSKIRSVLSQRYSGDITILPEVSYAQFPRVLMNPTTKFMSDAMLCGERATWPKLSQVRNHCAIELALDVAVQRCRYGLVFSKSQIDLRLNTFAVTAASKVAGTGKRRQRRRASHGSPPDPERSRLLAVPKSTSTPKRSFTTNDSSAASAHSPARLGIQPQQEQLSQDSGQDTAISSHPEESSPWEEEDTSSDDSQTSSSPPNHPALWPSTRPLFPSNSSPTTPNIASSKLHMSSPSLTLTKMDSKSILGLATAPVSPIEDRKFSAANAYGDSRREIFQNARVGLGNGQELDVDEVDMSGTRGMVRRKRSLTTGFRGLWPPR